MMKNRFCLGAVLTGLGLVLAACGAQPPTPSSSPTATSATGTLEKIKNSGEIVLGVRESSIPFSYLDNQQKSVGYSIDLCQKVVEAIKQELNLPNLQVKTNPVTSQTRIPLLTNGTIDLECGSTTNSQERQKQVAFSVAHFITAVRMAVKADSGITDLQDLQGKAVVTTSGTTSERYLKQNEQAKSLDIKTLQGKDHAESFLMLASGRADAFVLDDVLLAGLIAQAKDPQAFKIVGPTLSREPYGLMFRKNDPAFKALVDKTLTRLMATGAIEKTYNHWFMSPIPPQQINLNLPLSPDLKKAFEHPTDQGI
ncbi:transporter substrate-binding domain-containing protein [Synechocystis sp. LKSZ1]|uniref:transporter substrate-binding domain-containing protein n=1 Tax=Synechocystis sp. LKSZ1 TaxID=3144951 RepID=UPI00336C165D